MRLRPKSIANTRAGKLPSCGAERNPVELSLVAPLAFTASYDTPCRGMPRRRRAVAGQANGGSHIKINNFGNCSAIPRLRLLTIVRNCGRKCGHRGREVLESLAGNKEARRQDQRAYCRMSGIHHREPRLGSGSSLRVEVHAVRYDPEEKLQANHFREENCRYLECAQMREFGERHFQNPQRADHGGNSQHQMRRNADGLFPESSPQEWLHEHRRCCENQHLPDGGGREVRRLRLIPSPVGSRKQCQAYRQAEEGLNAEYVTNRCCRRKKIGQGAQCCKGRDKEDTGSYRSQIFQVRARIALPQTPNEQNGQCDYSDSQKHEGMCRFSWRTIWSMPGARSKRTRHVKEKRDDRDESPQPVQPGDAVFPFSHLTILWPTLGATESKTNTIDEGE